MQEEQKRIEMLEKDLVGIRYELSTNNETLKEIKNAILQQSEILRTVSAIRETVHQIRKDVNDLEDIFEDRKETTDNNNKIFSDFVSRTKGVIAACSIFFVIIQGVVGFVLNENYIDHKEFRKEVQELHIQNAILKEKLKRLNLDKSLQDALENKSEKAHTS